MKIVVVCANSRANSQSNKVANILLGKLQKIEGVEAGLIDLHKRPLPIYDDTEKPEWLEMSKELNAADGFVWVFPEWSGTAGPAIMNFVVYIGEGGQAAHKPVLLTAVSDGTGAAYPLAQVKAFGSKNGHEVFVPEQLRFREVKNLFNSTEPEPDNKADESMHARSQYALQVLVEYAKALKQMRESSKLDFRKYRSGY